MAEQNALIAKLAPQVEMLIPGAWAGALATAIMAWVSPSEAKVWIDALGSVMVLPVVVFVGVVLYLLYRVILGEWLLYPLRHALMSFCDIVRSADGSSRKRFWSITGVLRSYGANTFFIRQAYSVIRDAEDGPFDEAQRGRFDFLHATYHLFYVTGLELIAFGWADLGGDSVRALPVLKAGIAVLVVAFAADWRQDVWEARLMQSKSTATSEVLKRLGFEKS